MRPTLTDDSDLTVEEVKYDIQTSRALLLEQRLGGRFRVSDSFVSDLGCLELEWADAAECCGTIQSGCKILRTVKEVPQFVTIKGKVLLTRVGPIAQDRKPFSIITQAQAPYAGSGRFGKNQIYAFYANDRIYVVSASSNIVGLKYINVKGVLENPEDAAAFDCDVEGTKPCYSSDSKYPISGAYADIIRKMLLDEYAKLIQVPKDESNDGQDKMTDGV